MPFPHLLTPMVKSIAMKKQAVVPFSELAEAMGMSIEPVSPKRDVLSGAPTIRSVPNIAKYMPQTTTLVLLGSTLRKPFKLHLNIL